MKCIDVSAVHRADDNCRSRRLAKYSEVEQRKWGRAKYNARRGASRATIGEGRKESVNEKWRNGISHSGSVIKSWQNRLLTRARRGRHDDQDG